MIAGRRPATSRPTRDTTRRLCSGAPCSGDSSCPTMLFTKCTDFTNAHYSMLLVVFTIDLDQSLVKRWWTLLCVRLHVALLTWTSESLFLSNLCNALLSNFLQVRCSRAVLDHWDLQLILLRQTMFDWFACENDRRWCNASLLCLRPSCLLGFTLLWFVWSLFLNGSNHYTTDWKPILSWRLDG
jgi:hypothetical protein